MQGEHEKKLLKDESKIRWEKAERWFNRTGGSNRYKEELKGLWSLTEGRRRVADEGENDGKEGHKISD